MDLSSHEINRRTSAEVADPFAAWVDQGKNAVRELKQQQSFFGRMIRAVPGANLSEHESRLHSLQTRLESEINHLAQLEPTSHRYTKHNKQRLKLQRKIIEQKMMVLQDLKEVFTVRAGQENLQVGMDDYKQRLLEDIDAVRLEGYRFGAEVHVNNIFSRLVENKALVTADRVGGLDLGFKIAGNAPVVDTAGYEIAALQTEIEAIQAKLEEPDLSDDQKAHLREVLRDCLYEKIVLQKEQRGRICEAMADLELAENEGEHSLSIALHTLEESQKNDVDTMKPLLVEEAKQRAKRNALTTIQHKEQASWFDPEVERDPYPEVKSEVMPEEFLYRRLEAAASYIDTMKRELNSSAGIASPAHRQRVEDHLYKARLANLRLQENFFDTFEWASQDREESEALLAEEPSIAKQELVEQRQIAADLKYEVESASKQDLEELLTVTTSYYRQRALSRFEAFIESGKTAKPSGVPEPVNASNWITEIERMSMEVDELNILLGKLDELLQEQKLPGGEKLSKGKIERALQFYEDLARERVELAASAQKNLRAEHAENERDGPVPEVQIALDKRIESFSRIKMEEAKRLQDLMQDRAEVLAQKRVVKEEDSSTMIGRMGRRLFGGEKRAVTKHEVWKYEPWGEILLSDDLQQNSLTSMKETASRLMRSNFENSVDAKIVVMRQAEADLWVMNDQLKEIKTALGVSPRPSREERERLLTEERELNEAIKNTRTELLQAQISEKATILQRIVDKTGDRAYTRNQKQQELKASMRQIAAMNQEILWAQNALDRDQADLDIELTDESPLFIRSIIEETEAGSAARTQRLEQHIQQTRENLSGYQTEVRERGIEVDRLDRELAILDQAYYEQMQEYGALKPPRRGFMEMMNKGLTDEAARFLTGGLYGMPVYVRPEEFRTKYAFAEKGYCLAAGVKEWKNWEGSGLTEMITQQVNDFCDWADSHPAEASRMAVDVSLAINLIQDNDIKKTLLSAVNTKIYSEAMLGSLGREYGVREVKPEHFRFMALAELARYGPQMNAGVRAGAAAANQLVEGNIGRALLSGVATYTFQQYKGDVLQRFVNTIDMNQARAVKAGLQALQGDDMQTILSAQRDIEIARLAGEARQGVRSPKKALKSLGRRLIEPFRAIRKSGSWTERTIRTLTIIAPPLAGVGVAGGIAAQAAAGAIGVPLAIGTGLLSVVGGLFFLAPLVYKLTNLAYPKTHARMKQEHAEGVIEREYSAELIQQRDLYLQDLKSKRAIPLADPELLEKEETQTEVAWRNTIQDPQKSIKTEIADLLNQEKERALAEKRELEMDPEYVQLSPQECVKIYSQTLKRYKLHERLKERVEESSLSFSSVGGHEEPPDEVLASVEHRILRDLFDGWLKDNVDVAVRQEFVNRYNSYDSPVQFERDQKKFFQDKKKAQDAAMTRFQDKIIGEHPKEHDLGPGVEERLREEVAAAVKASSLNE